MSDGKTDEGKSEHHSHSPKVKKKKKDHYNANKLFRTLYGIGIGVTILCLVMTCLAHVNSVTVCKFGYLDPKSEIITSLYEGGFRGHTDEPFVLNFGLWTYCVNEDCGPVSKGSESAEVGELNKAFLKMGGANVASSMLILSQVMALAIICYFIAASVKVLRMKVPLIILTSLYLVSLTGASVMFTDWMIANMRPYDGYCELTFFFTLPWIALICAFFGLVSITINLYLVKYVKLK